MLTIYGHTNTRSLRTTWLAEELGLDYQFQQVNLAEGEHKGEAHRRIHPGGKIPAIADNGFTLTESGAIANYLADKYAPGKLTPPFATAERALYDRWCYFALCELEQPLWNIGKHKFVLPKEHRVKEIMPTAAWEYQQALALLSDGLGQQQYILGDQFSAADILLLQTLQWGAAFGQALNQQNLQDYLARGQARPAYQRALAKETAA
ncbi:Glutathione S-transferase GST-6.0 [Sinobacterium norvegicum]|uniref:Glutathione S-transferase GST-6.0 n=1 Tax=Sinobacterium norvegicum TaxID=1641715 RepID=A0ABN8EMJ5_9GAMM|nr:glutathione S-transferase family protein [Sinobacterium norvegicum]CAH0992607.1 Glutathione S-transferase GST-6.0 [Sinobacterium norvegicum]